MLSLTKSKHIDIKYLVVIERVQNKQFSIEHIGTNSMIADPLNKEVLADETRPRGRRFHAVSHQK